MNEKSTVVSVNVGLPRIVMRDGEPVSTGIFKNSVEGRIAVRTLNLDGDRQADLSVHGGLFKAVYGYPSEHYEFWQRDLERDGLPWGMFGENLTTTGLFESDLNIGDTFQMGSAVLMVTQPRLPCYKLGIRFERSDILRKFLKSELTGFYFSVVQEGDVGAGDAIVPVHRERDAVSVRDITRLYTVEKNNRELIRRAIDTPALPASWKDWLRERSA